MPEEQRTQGESAGASVKAAAKTGKAVSDIAKGAATGGAHGAALAKSRPWRLLFVSACVSWFISVRLVRVELNLTMRRKFSRNHISRVLKLIHTLPVTIPMLISC